MKIISTTIFSGALGKRSTQLNAKLGTGSMVTFVFSLPLRVKKSFYFTVRYWAPMQVHIICTNPQFMMMLTPCFVF